MEKAEYVKRLKGMLTNRNKPCQYCPVESAYIYRGQNTDKCKICQEFVGLEALNPLLYRCCPCSRPNAERAIARAWAAIRAYEAKHK